MAGDITGILYGLWYNFKAVVLVVEPICEFVAETRQYSREVDGREYGRVARTRSYDFEAEDRCE